jgi:hypothetical protein
MRQPLVTRASKAALQATDQLIGPDAADVPEVERVPDDEVDPDVITEAKSQTIWDFTTATTMVDAATIAHAINASLPPDLALEAREMAQRLRKVEDNFYYHMGEGLASIRPKMRHGQWLAWLEYEIGISNQTALNYIGFYELAQRTDVELIKLMRPSAAYALARAPKVVQDRLIKQAKDGDRITTEAVRTACRNHLILEQQAELCDAEAPEADDDTAPEKADVTPPSDADSGDAAPEQLEEVAEVFATTLVTMLQDDPERLKYYRQARDLSRDPYQCQVFMTRLVAGLRPRHRH